MHAAARLLIAVSLFLLIAASATYVDADEQSLVQQFNAVVSLMNGGDYEQGRTALDAFEKAARAVPKEDPAYERAQELLGRTNELRTLSYHNSYIRSVNAAKKALHEGRIKEAQDSLEQAVKDLTALAAQQPDSDEYRKHLQAYQQQLAQSRVANALLGESAVDQAELASLAGTEPKLLYGSAPSFHVPLWNSPKLFGSASAAAAPLLVQIWQAADPSAPLAAQTLTAVQHRYQDSGVRLLALSLDEGEGLKRLGDFMAAHAPAWAVAIDDRSEFYSQYMQSGYRLPAYVWIRSDGQASWISGDNPLDTLLSLFQTLERDLRTGGVRGIAGPDPWFPVAAPIPVVSEGSASMKLLEFGDEPTLAFITDGERVEYLQELEVVQEQSAAQLRVMGILLTDNRAMVRQLTARHNIPLFQARWGLPDCYAPNFRTRVVLITASGRVLKVASLSPDPQHRRAVLQRFAEVLTHRSAYPSQADAPERLNLAGRVVGGSVDRVSSEKSSGSAPLLNDGRLGTPGWTSAGEHPQDILLTLGGGESSRIDRLLVDWQAGAAEAELWAAEANRGGFQLVKQFRLEQRTGLQAFEFPKTQAQRVQLRITSVAARDGALPVSQIGEIAVEGAADLERRVREPAIARMHRIEETFADPRLLFWQQLELHSGPSSAAWLVQREAVSCAPSSPGIDLRASALLHQVGHSGDFDLQTVLASDCQAGGLVFGFQDWNNFYRLMLVKGHVQTNRPEGNSIRLERWHDGQLEVLGVLGEPWPLNKPIRVNVLRRGKHLAVLLEQQPVFRLELPDDLTGRAGFCAAGQGRLAAEEFQLDLAPASRSLADLAPNALSINAGASVAWLNRQGTAAEPATWAVNLLHAPVFAQAGAWTASIEGSEPPEVVLAFRDHQRVAVRSLGFSLPESPQVPRADWVRAVEVHVSDDVALRRDKFQLLGTFTLDPKAGDQWFQLPRPANCRYLAIRLVENAGGKSCSLGRVKVQLADTVGGTDAAAADEVAALEQQFDVVADLAEQEPNDTRPTATRLEPNRLLEGSVQVGEVDWIRLPEAPASRGTRTLRLRLEALPWLRVSADVSDAAGSAIQPPLADLDATLSVEQVRSIPPAGPVPQWVRIQMPASSLALVVDTSGSLGGQEVQLREAVTAYLQGAVAGEQVEVLQFASDVKSLGRLPEDRERVLSEVSNLQARGNTALYQALLDAMQRNQAVVLLSDGMNTVPEFDFTALCRALRARPVPIYVIGVGWDLYEYDMQSGNTAFGLLANLARQTGGRFYFAPGTEQLEQLYRRVGDEVRAATRYRLRAEWEVFDRETELAVLAPASNAGRGPALVGLPAAAVELSMVQRRGRVHTPAVASLPPAGELASSISSGGAAEPFATALPGVLQFAPSPALPSVPLAAMTLPARGELASITPAIGRSMTQPPMPAFGAVRLIYRSPPDAPQLPPAVMPAYELILDSSESMKELLQGRQKLALAQDVVSDVVKSLPNDTQVGLRIYGYWGVWILRRQDPKAGKLPWSDPRVNEDSQLVVEIGPLTPARRRQMEAWIRSARPQGKTPLVYSLLQARRDFPPAWKGPKTVVLVSDGVETCGGKLEDLVAAYRESDVQAVVHVVGFDIRGSDAEQQLREIASIGGGQYYSAANARQLTRALQQAVAGGAFAVHSPASGHEIARGQINGPPIDLPIGSYRLRLPGVRMEPMPIDVVAGETGVFELTQEGTLQRQIDGPLR